MPILVRLDDVLHARRMTLTELSEQIGITLANLSILKTGKARAVRFSTLEAICAALECQPGDLLAFDPTHTRKHAMKLFIRNFDHYEGVRPAHIYLLRTLFLLMFLFVGYDSWSTILRHERTWDPMQAVAWCTFASYSSLSIIGVCRPLKMLPLMVFMVVYKSLWLLVVAYPLWSTGQLAGSNAEGMTRVFLIVPVAIIAIPWRYFVQTYLLNRNASVEPH